MKQTFPIFCLCLFIALGCGNSNNDNNDTAVVDTDSDTIVQYDTEDSRGIPLACEEDADCDDGDPCTSEFCSAFQTCQYEAIAPSVTLVPFVATTPILDATIDGNRVYLAVGEEGVKAYNIDDALTMGHRGDAATVAPAIAVDAGNGGFAVALGDAGIELFANDNLEEHQRHVSADSWTISRLDLSVNVDAGGDHIVVSGFEEGLALATTNLAEPEHAGGINTPGRVVSTASSRHNRVLAADSLGGARMAYYNEDDRLVEGGRVHTEGRVLDVDAYGNTGIMAEYGAGFSLLDISDPVDPSRLVRITTPEHVVAVRLLGRQTGLVLLEGGTVRIYSFADANNPHPTATFEIGGTPLPHSVDMDGTRGVLTLEDGTVLLFNLECNSTL